MHQIQRSSRYPSCEKGKERTEEREKVRARDRGIVRKAGSERAKEREGLEDWLGGYMSLVGAGAPPLMFNRRRHTHTHTHARTHADSRPHFSAAAAEAAVSASPCLLLICESVTLESTRMHWRRWRHRRQRRMRRSFDSGGRGRRLMLLDSAVCSVWDPERHASFTAVHDLACVAIMIFIYQKQQQTNNGQNRRTEATRWQRKASSKHKVSKSISKASFKSSHCAKTITGPSDVDDLTVKCENCEALVASFVPQFPLQERRRLRNLSH